MSNEMLSGLLLGFAYTAPIGAQNLYVISLALKVGSPKNILVALIVVAMDFSLAVACVMGVGALLNGHQLIRLVIGVLGGLYLLYISFSAIREMSRAREISNSDIEIGWYKIVAQTFFLTWLNPHAIIDGSSILGNFAASLNLQQKAMFLSGVGVSSLLWFTSISCIAASLKGPKGARFGIGAKAFSAVVIAYFALAILYSSFNEWLTV